MVERSDSESAVTSPPVNTSVADFLGMIVTQPKTASLRFNILCTVYIGIYTYPYTNDKHIASDRATAEEDYSHMGKIWVLTSFSEF